VPFKLWVNWILNLYSPASALSAVAERVNSHGTKSSRERYKLNVKAKA
jgi:hypothetical protein